MILDYAKRLRGLAGAALDQLLWQPESNETVALLFERRAAREGGTPFLWFERRWWTVGEVNAAMNRHAHAYKALGLRRGDAVALAMGNCPSYLFHLYGLAKIGVVAALLNPSLRQVALAHALDSSGAKLVVVDPPRAAAMSELGRALPCYVDEEASAGGDATADDQGGETGELLHAAGPPEGARSWQELLSTAPDHDPPETAEHRLADVCAYMYTSGTTGLPKAAIVKHHRLWRGGHLMAGILALEARDCLYVCLPMYHASATILGAPMALITRGARLALARRFSASRFFVDCADAHATVALYIGELCRYLLNQPARDSDQAHPLRAMLGNGLRADVWEPFQQRFGVERIVEFYAATEGNAETVNVLGTPGSCGVLVPGRMALVRYDLERDEVIRDRRGFCKRTAAGEIGLLLGHIEGKNEYAGYRDAAATRSKVLRDVFKRGDTWFNTGDLLRRDHLRRLYFVDRLGDTYRWKGENVSTQEVGEQLGAHDDVLDCTVYGVEVPGNEGRAGMAALVLREGGAFGTAAELDGAAMYAHASVLPSYARPRFLRVVGSVQTTTTFKHRKRSLASEGFDPARVDEPLYVLDSREQSYVRLDGDLFADVVGGAWVL